MGIQIRELGECQPVCNDCGIFLCWSIDELEYYLYRVFWDEWRCRDCNPDYKGAYERFKAENNTLEKLLNLTELPAERNPLLIEVPVI